MSEDNQPRIHINMSGTDPAVVVAAIRRYLAETAMDKDDEDDGGRFPTEWERESRSRPAPHDPGRLEGGLSWRQRRQHRRRVESGEVARMQHDAQPLSRQTPWIFADAAFPHIHLRWSVGGSRVRWWGRDRHLATA